jgi:taurine--2-oxoglutarate transaminase
MQDDLLVGRAAAMGAMLRRYLTDLGEQHPSVGEVRSIGLFGAIELVRDRETRQPLAPYNGSSPEMTALRSYMLEHGVFVYTHWHTILIVPPLIINEEQLAEGFAVLDKALEITDAALGK